MHSELDEVTTMNIMKTFQLDEIDIAGVSEYPVKLLYEQEQNNFGNIVIFNNPKDLTDFLFLRNYMIKNMGASDPSPGKIRIFE